MKTYHYAILPLFAFSLAVSSPVLAGEGDSPNASKDATGSSSQVYEKDATGVNKTDDETAKLPFEEDPDQNDPGTGDAATPSGTGESSAAGAADGGTGNGGTGNGGTGGGGTGGGGTN